MKKALSFFLLLFPLLALCAQEARDPLRYEIWVSLDPAHKMLNGRETIAWTNTTKDTVPDIWFHLYWNAFKNEKSALMEEALRAGRKAPTTATPTSRTATGAGLTWTGSALGTAPT